jgi:hypothetical protein
MGRVHPFVFSKADIFPSGRMALLVGLSAWFLSPAFAQIAPPPRPTLATEVSGPRHHQAFRITENADSLRLAFEWMDFERKIRTIDFAIDRSALAAAEVEFGYSPQDLEAHLESIERALTEEWMGRLRDKVFLEVRKSAYAADLAVTKFGPDGFQLLPRSSSPPTGMADFVTALSKEIDSERERFGEKLKKCLEEEMTGYLALRGFRADGRVLKLDYPCVVRQSRSFLRPIVRALEGGCEGRCSRDFLNLLLSFIQAIPVVSPPEEENGKIISGVWMPARVLINNGGDCDSKAITLATLWREHAGDPLAIFEVPKHVLVGVALPMVGDECASVMIQGRRYALMETCCPTPLPVGKILPGSRSALLAGNYRCVRIVD